MLIYLFYDDNVDDNDDDDDDLECVASSHDPITIPITKEFNLTRKYMPNKMFSAHS